MSKKTKISVFIPTYNSEKSIVNTLKSVVWADEVLVVDSFSTDLTVDIVESFGVKLLFHEFVNPSLQKNWGIENCSYDWVLQIDSDEVLEPGAEQEIRKIVESSSEKYIAYKIPRKNHIMGNWFEFAGIYPDYQYRLFRKAYCKFDGRRVHENLIIPGEVGVLEHHILHFGMPNVSKQLSNLDRYTTWEVEELIANGTEFKWWRLLIFPWVVFFQRYILLKGILGGWRGLIICMYMAVYQFFLYAKLWENNEIACEENA